jgi:hypothetical protein
MDQHFGIFVRLLMDDNEEIATEAARLIANLTRLPLEVPEKSLNTRSYF